MHINFDAIYQGGNKFESETRDTNYTYRLFNFSDQQKPPFWSADAQFILLRILRSSKYIKNTLN